MSWRQAGMAEARKKILCIEDDRETAKLIAEELSERGFYVVIAYDGRIGLAAILKRIPDLVLCDVGLPEMSGFEVLARLNERVLRLNRVPFLFLTGMSGRHDELQGRNLGADDYVTKPIDFDILEAIIRARLAGGIARHEIAVKLPKQRDLYAEALVRRAQGRTASNNKTSSKSAPQDRIVELIDAPTVDFHADNANPTRQSTTHNEPVARAAMDWLIKR
jgi:DNA-binding response OmpR family regulator